MQVSRDEHIKLEEDLEYNFLYNKDNDSINILISILHNKNVGNFLKPGYSCIKYIITNLNKYLYQLENQALIVSQIKKEITDDINRFELITFIKAYNLAQKDFFLLDRIERCALKYYTSDFLVHKKDLFENLNDNNTLKIKDWVISSVKEDKTLMENLKIDCMSYAERMFKNKILKLDVNVCRQFSMLEDNIAPEKNNLDIKMMQNIYKKILIYMINEITDIFCEAYWRSLNEIVLKRYQ